MTQRKSNLVAVALKATFELAIVFVGVLAALWVDAWQDERARNTRAIAIAQAMSTEMHRSMRSGQAASEMDNALLRITSDNPALNEPPAWVGMREWQACWTPSIRSL